MSPAPSILRSCQRWCVLTTIILVEAAIWINSTDSGIAKQPLFVLGATLIVALFLAETILIRQLEFSFSVIGILVALHLPLFVCSALFSFDPISTWAALAFGMSCVIFFFAGTSLFTARKNVQLLFRALQALTIVLCIIALLQFFLADVLPVNFDTGTEHRASSLLGNSIYFSSYLVLVFPVLLGQFAHPDSGNKARLFRGALLALVVIAMLSTQTRSSMLGWLTSLPAFAMLYSSSRKKQLAAIIAVSALLGTLAFAGLIRPDLGQRFLTLFGERRGTTVARRVYFWTAGRDAFLASPVFGHGIGSFEREVFDYRSPDYWEVASEDVVPHAHNEVIEIAVEYGIIGLALFAATLAIVFRQGKVLSRTGDEWQRRTSAGITSGLIAVGVDNLANVSLRQPPIAVLVWLLMGLLFSKSLTSRQEKKVHVPFPLPPVASAAPLLVWVIFAFAYSNNEVKVIGADVHFLRGLQSGENSHAGALQEYAASVVENPSNLRARSYMINELIHEGRWEDALHSSAELQHLSPSYPKSSLMAGYALLRLGRYHEALESIQKELERRSHPEAYMLAAAACRGLGDVEGEQNALRDLLKKDIEAKTPYEYRSSCERLMELCSTESDREENAALFASLQKIVAGDREFFEKLELQTRVKQQPILSDH